MRCFGLLSAYILIIAQRTSAICFVPFINTVVNGICLYDKSVIDPVPECKNTPIARKLCRRYCATTKLISACANNAMIGAKCLQLRVPD